jgi:hypothetical protein
VEIELLAVAGAAYEVLDDRDDTFTFNPALISVLDDNVDSNDVPFNDTFPYYANAQSGQEHFHENPTEGPLGLAFGSFTVEAGATPRLYLVLLGVSLSLVGTVEFLRRRRTHR